MKDRPEMTKGRPMHSLRIFPRFLNFIHVKSSEENRLLSDVNTPAQQEIALTRFFTVEELRAAIRILNPKKAPSYNLISNQVLQKLPVGLLAVHSASVSDARLILNYKYSDGRYK